jgi:hypothetical protein
MNDPKAESTDNTKIGPDKWLSGHAPSSPKAKSKNSSEVRSFL